MLQNYTKTGVRSVNSIRTRLDIRPFQFTSAMTSATVNATDTFNDVVKYALERVGKAGIWCSSLRKWKLFVVCTKKRMCLCFINVLRGRLSASKFCPFYSITNTLKLATQAQQQEGVA